MAKRFITTDMFEDAWFMDLPSKYKLLWIFLISKCDHAGIWQVNFKVAQFYTGEHLEPIECERIFKDRIIKLDDGKYWFIPKFISFQYGHLNERVKAHKSVIDILTKKELLQTVSKQLPNCLITVKDKDKDKDKDIDKEKEEFIKEGSQVQKLWIKTFGRNPKIPEYEETEKLLKKYDYDTIHKTFKEAALRNIKSLSYLMANIDSNGDLLPYGKKEEIRELK